MVSIARGLPAGPAVVLLTALVLPQTPIQADRALYEKAELARKQGKEAEALELFEKALDRLPGDVDTHVGYQKLLQSQGKDAQLIEEYGKLLEKRQEPWCYYLLGRVLHDPAREEELYRKGLMKDPESFDLRAALAWALKRQVKRTEAAKEYLQALRLRPDSLKTHSRYMDVVREMGNASTLPDMYRRRLEKDPDDYRSHLLYGYALVKSGALEKSEQPFLRAREIAPREVVVLRSLGTFHLKKNEIDEGQRYFEQAKEIEPYNSGTLLPLGLILLLFRNDPGGLKLMLEAARLEPADADVSSKLGVAYSAKGDDETTEHYLRQALRFDPAHHLALSNLGNLFLWKRNHGQAIACFRKAINLYGEDASYHGGLAQGYRMAKQFDLAREALERAEKLKIGADLSAESSADGLRVRDREELRSLQLEQLAVALVFDGKVEEAKRRFQEALADQPESFGVYWGLARVHHRLGELEKALELYRALRGVCERVEKYHRAVPMVSLRVADCLYDLGRTEEALSRYRAVWTKREKFPGYQDLDRVMRAIDSAPEDAESFRLDHVRIGECAREKYCVPGAIFAVLKSWDLDVDLKVLGDDLVVPDSGAFVHDVMDYLDTKEGVTGCCFTARTGQVKKLLRQGYPLILVHHIPSELDFLGHASVIVGFDDRLGVFLLEDSNWFAGLDRIPYDSVDGARAIALGPPERIQAIEASLPDREYHIALNQAERLLKKEDVARARKVITKAIRLRDDDYSAHLYLGLCYEVGNELDLAIEAYRRATELPRGQAMAHYKLGLAYLRSGEKERARAAFQATADLEPGHIGAQSHVCFIHLQLGEFDKALPITEKLVTLKPRSAEYHLWRGVALGRTGNTKEAIPLLYHAARLGGPAQCYWHLAEFNQKEGQLGEAIHSLEKFRDLTDDPQQKASANRMLERLRKRVRKTIEKE